MERLAQEFKSRTRQGADGSDPFYQNLPVDLRAQSA